uniref:Uncharacterized protein n=1 Tax=Anopheles albimanus TaxID=7167 RepID=A0A182FXB1_ANOAL
PNRISKVRRPLAARTVGKTRKQYIPLKFTRCGNNNYATISSFPINSFD